MTARGPAPKARSVTKVIRPAAGNRPSIRHPVRRVARIAPVLRPFEPPAGPSRHDVVALWEELDCWSCVYCDRPFGPTVVSEVDHVTPLAKGGVHEWGNLVLSCRECNCLKSDLDIADWLALLAGGSSAERDAPNTQSCIDVWRLPSQALHEVTVWSR
jgi:hypothetical protein